MPQAAMAARVVMAGLGTPALTARRPGHPVRLAVLVAQAARVVPAVPAAALLRRV
jgi:hypothetical protein